MFFITFNFPFLPIMLFLAVSGNKQTSWIKMCGSDKNVWEKKETNKKRKKRRGGGKETEREGG